MPTILIVGASRGIGAELVRQFTAIKDYEVIAAVRNTIQSQGDDVKYIALDQNSSASVAAAAKEVEKLDILVLNAAIGLDERLETTSDDRFREYLETNVIGPHRVVQAFLPALLRGERKNIVFISSTSGSLAKQVEAIHGFAGPYAVTKAAENMLAVQYQNELKKNGVCVVAVHPGWVATDMGKLAGDGGISVAESVIGLQKIILGLRKEDGARFLDYDGTTLPW